MLEWPFWKAAILQFKHYSAVAKLSLRTFTIFNLFGSDIACEKGQGSNESLQRQLIHLKIDFNWMGLNCLWNKDNT